MSEVNNELVQQLLDEIKEETKKMESHLYRDHLNLEFVEQGGIIAELHSDHQMADKATHAFTVNNLLTLFYNKNTREFIKGETEGTYASRVSIMSKEELTRFRASTMRPEEMVEVDYFDVEDQNFAQQAVFEGEMEIPEKFIEACLERIQKTLK